VECPYLLILEKPEKCSKVVTTLAYFARLMMVKKGFVMETTGPLLYDFLQSHLNNSER
jgi:hypothetical protein